MPPQHDENSDYFRMVKKCMPIDYFSLSSIMPFGTSTIVSSGPIFDKSPNAWIFFGSTFLPMIKYVSEILFSRILGQEPIMHEYSCGVLSINLYMAGHAPITQECFGLVMLIKS